MHIIIHGMGKVEVVDPSASTSKEPHPRENNEFNFEVEPAQSVKQAWTYSPSLKKIYTKMNKSIPFKIRWQPTSSNLNVRACLIYADPIYENYPVERCKTHKAADDPSNIGFPDVNHLVRSDNIEAFHVYDTVTTQRSVMVPLEEQQAGTDYAMVTFKFMCQNSCSAPGISRRLTKLSLTLEKNDGCILATECFDIRICSCPKRDMENEKASKKFIATDRVPYKKKNKNLERKFTNEPSNLKGKPQRMATWQKPFSESIEEICVCEPTSNFNKINSIMPFSESSQYDWSVYPSTLKQDPLLQIVGQHIQNSDKALNKIQRKSLMQMIEEANIQSSDTEHSEEGGKSPLQMTEEANIQNSDTEHSEVEEKSLMQMIEEANIQNSDTEHSEVEEKSLMQMIEEVDIQNFDMKHNEVERKSLMQMIEEANIQNSDTEHNEVEEKPLVQRIEEDVENSDLNQVMGKLLIWNDENEIPNITDEPINKKGKKSSSLVSTDTDYIPIITNKPINKRGRKPKSLVQINKDYISNITDEPINKKGRKSSSLVSTDKDYITNKPINKRGRKSKLLVQTDKDYVPNITDEPINKRGRRSSSLVCTDTDYITNKPINKRGRKSKLLVQADKDYVPNIADKPINKRGRRSSSLVCTDTDYIPNTTNKPINKRGRKPKSLVQIDRDCIPNITDKPINKREGKPAPVVVIEKEHMEYPTKNVNKMLIDKDAVMEVITIAEKSFILVGANTQQKYADQTSNNCGNSSSFTHFDERSIPSSTTPVSNKSRNSSKLIQFGGKKMKNPTMQVSNYYENSTPLMNCADKNINNSTMQVSDNYGNSTPLMKCADKNTDNSTMQVSNNYGNSTPLMKCADENIDNSSLQVSYNYGNSTPLMKCADKSIKTPTMQVIDLGKNSAPLQQSDGKHFIPNVEADDIFEDLLSPGEMSLINEGCATDIDYLMNDLENIEDIFQDYPQNYTKFNKSLKRNKNKKRRVEDGTRPVEVQFIDPNIIDLTLDDESDDVTIIDSINPSQVDQMCSANPISHDLFNDKKMADLAKDDTTRKIGNSNQDETCSRHSSTVDENITDPKLNDQAKTETVIDSNKSTHVDQMCSTKPVLHDTAIDKIIGDLAEDETRKMGNSNQDETCSRHSPNVDNNINDLKLNDQAEAQKVIDSKKSSLVDQMCCAKPVFQDPTTNENMSDLAEDESARKMGNSSQDQTCSKDSPCVDENIKDLKLNDQAKTETIIDSKKSSLVDQMCIANPITHDPIVDENIADLAEDEIRKMGNSNQDQKYSKDSPDVGEHIKDHTLNDQAEAKTVMDSISSSHVDQIYSAIPISQISGDLADDDTTRKICNSNQDQNKRSSNSFCISMDYESIESSDQEMEFKTVRRNSDSDSDLISNILIGVVDEVENMEENDVTRMLLRYNNCLSVETFSCLRRVLRFIMPENMSSTLSQSEGDRLNSRVDQNYINIASNQHVQTVNFPQALNGNSNTGDTSTNNTSHQEFAINLSPSTWQCRLLEGIRSSLLSLLWETPCDTHNYKELWTYAADVNDALKNSKESDGTISNLKITLNREKSPNKK